MQNYQRGQPDLNFNKRTQIMVHILILGKVDMKSLWWHIQHCHPGNRDNTNTQTPTYKPS